MQLTPAEAETETPNDNAIGRPSSRQLSGHLSTSLSTSPPSSPFGSAIPIAGTNAFREAFLAPIHAAPIRIGLRVQRALSDVTSSISALEGEYLPLHPLHRVPPGATGVASHAAQLMLDFLIMTFALKMENSHLSPWRIPALQYKHMIAIASSVADALDSLQNVVLGDTKSIKTTLKCLDDVEEGIARHIQETLASVSNTPVADIVGEETISKQISMEKVKDNQPKNKPPQLHMEVLVLLYMGISISQQFKILCSATARAFLTQNEAVVAEIDRKALGGSEFGFENSSKDNNDKNDSTQAATHEMPAASTRSSQGLEYLMARVLESTHSWPTSTSTSSIIETAGLSGLVPVQEEEQNKEEELKEVVTRAK